MGFTVCNLLVVSFFARESLPMRVVTNRGMIIQTVHVGNLGLYVWEIND